MLLKQFLNKEEVSVLLNIANNLKYENEAYGTNCYLVYLKELNDDDAINLVCERAVDLYKDKFAGYKFEYDKSCFFLIKDKGWVSPHDDRSENGKAEVTNLVLLLQKPSEGGNILYGHQRIIMQEGDAYALNEKVVHGVETVKSEIPFIALILWFKKHLISEGMVYKKG